MRLTTPFHVGWTGTNCSAVYYEQADYPKAIETAEKAVEEARGLRADFKLVAK